MTGPEGPALAELSVNVAVVGSGAAGLVAACRAADGGRSVAVLEKAELLGGTSAISGGVMWMPANHLMGEEYRDSVEDALAYLAVATGGRVPTERLRWYVLTSKEAVRWLDEHTVVALAPLPRPDYHTDWPGASRGRGLDLLPFDGTEYPGLTARIRPPTYFATITMTERDAMAATGIDTDLVARRDAGGTRTMGGALVAALVASAEERGIAVRSGFGVQELRRDGDSWVLAGPAGTSGPPRWSSPPVGTSGTRACRRRSCPIRSPRSAPPATPATGSNSAWRPAGRSTRCAPCGACRCCRILPTATTVGSPGGWRTSS